jgi:hypothetical protein
VPDEWSNAQAADALDELVVHLRGQQPPPRLGFFARFRKALANPTPAVARARARRKFEGLQRGFASEVQVIFEGMDDTAQTARALLALKGLPVKEARGILSEHLKRVHTRSIALLNARFRRDYEEAFRLGLIAGGADREPTNNELSIIKRQRLNENTFAANFLTDIAHGEGSMSYKRRAAMYGNALEELYWQGYLYADLSADRFVKWTMPQGSAWEPPEHCVDCARLSGNLGFLKGQDRERVTESGLPVGGRWGNGVYQARELATMGVAPQSGKLTCTTHCKCHLEPAKKPDAKPQGKAEKRFRSLEPKEFTGTHRDKDGRVVVDRAHKTERRGRYAKRAVKTEHEHSQR